MNKQNRYRIIDKDLLKVLELKPNKGQRYRLNPTQERKYLALRGDKIKRLFFDIETSPLITYSWRVGYNLTLGYDNIIEHLKIICVSYKWEHDEKVYNLSWNPKTRSDKKLIQDFAKIFNSADEVIAHNGDRFDIKHLRTRALINGVNFRPTYRSLDTLKKSRSSFKFPTNKLNDIGQFLGVGEKEKHEGFTMWKKCMNGDTEALEKMLSYCDRDVILLEDVFHNIQNYITNNTHAGVINGGMKTDCPNCGHEHPELLRNEVTPKGTIQRLLECPNCTYNYKVSNGDWTTHQKYQLRTKN